MESAFTEWKIVPEVIDTLPAAVAEVVWPNGVKADMGKMLTPTQVKDQPKVTFPHEAGCLYTVIMTDPDAPKDKAEVHHWMTINVKDGDSETGAVHSEYFGSGPPQGTGIHRYIFLVYKQPPNYTPTEAYRPRNRERRYLWSVRQFAKDNNLGDPVAGNFYRAEFDSYVPTLHAELSAATPQV